MEEKDKNRKTGLSGFLRYRENNLTGTERNAFERELQKDPFAEEAEEGFSTLGPGQIRKDMDILNKRLKSRTNRSIAYIFYRIAASVAVLMIITTVFILIQRNGPTQQEKIAESEVVSAAPSTVQSPPVEKRTEIKLTKAAKPAQQPVLAIAEKAEHQAVKQTDDIKIKAERIIDYNVIDSMPSGKSSTSKESAGLAATEVSRSDTLELYKAHQIVIVAAEPSAPAYGETRARSAVAENEKKSDLTKDLSYAGYVPAAPVNGKEEFNKYIEENLRRPSARSESQRVVVELSFIVRSDGRPDSIKVISSPAQPYADEAIRLIIEGPRWIPASENGNIFEEEVKVKIVFR